MPKVSTKHRRERVLQVSPRGGINLSLPPHQIADQEMARAENFVYEPNTDRLVVRAGIAKFTTASAGATLKVTATHVFYDGTTSYVMAVTYNPATGACLLWYIDESAPPAKTWAPVLDAAGAQQAVINQDVCFLNWYGQKVVAGPTETPCRTVLIAHGGHLLEWGGPSVSIWHYGIGAGAVGIGAGRCYPIDNNTAGDLSPVHAGVNHQEYNHPHPTIIFGMSDRVVACGGPTMLNRIQMSAPGNARQWSWGDDGGAAIAGVPLQYDGAFFDIGREGLVITGAHLWHGEYQEIMVHLRGQDKEIYRAVIRDPGGYQFDANFVVPKFASGIDAALNWRCCTTVAGRHLYFGDSGFQGMVGDTAFDEVHGGEFGKQVNSNLLPDTWPWFSNHPKFRQLWVYPGGLAGRIYVYDYTAQPMGRWTTMLFANRMIPYSACYHEGRGKMLIGMGDGYLYEMDPAVGTDDGNAYPADIETKIWANGLNEMLVKEILFEQENIRAADPPGYLRINMDNSSRTIYVMDVPIERISPMIYLCTQLIVSSTDPIYGIPYRRGIRKFHVRCENFQFALHLSNGALRWHNLAVKFASIGRAVE